MNPWFNVIISRKNVPILPILVLLYHRSLQRWPLEQSAALISYCQDYFGIWYALIQVPPDNQLADPWTNVVLTIFRMKLSDDITYSTTWFRWNNLQYPDTGVVRHEFPATENFLNNLPSGLYFIVNQKFCSVLKMKIPCLSHVVNIRLYSPKDLENTVQIMVILIPPATSPNLRHLLMLSDTCLR